MKKILPTNTIFEFSAGLRSWLNLLILLHILFFAFYCALRWNGMLALPLGSGSVEEHIRNVLAVSSRAEAWPFNWTVSPFTYQFVHFKGGELALSMSMLWLFGHVLKKRIGERKALAFYFLLTCMSALVFNLSHLVFPIFSGPGGFMEGAFGGTLGVMTAAVVLYGSHRFKIGRHIRFSLRHVYFIALLISFVLVYKNNMAYVLVYAFNIYMGIKYVSLFEKREARLRGDNMKLAYQEKYNL